MNFKDARATLGKMAKGKYHTLEVSIWPQSLIGTMPDYVVYISGYGFAAGKSWQKAISKLQEKMLGK